MGSTELPIWPHGKRDVLLFNITGDDLAPLLSYSTCIELEFVTINDCDRAVASNSFGLDSTPSVAVTTGITDLLDEYKDVFQGLGDLPGEYHIVTDDAVPPVVLTPRRVQVALRDQIKNKLNEMVASDVITPVTEPTEWVSMEEVATRLSQAKKFTVVDAKDGFWQKRLDTESSYKTTFNTPFGRYRWNRVPFCICSAPEVWQCIMHEFVKDLEGVEVIADDFLIAGFGIQEFLYRLAVRASNFKSKISTSEWKSGKCCEDLQRTALEGGGQTRPIVGDPPLAQHPKNRCQPRSTMELSPVPNSNNEEPHQTENESRSPHQTENESRSPVLPEPVPDQCQIPLALGTQENDTLSPAHSVPDSTELASALPPRRSGRTRRIPTWLEDYDLC
ncbi:Transposon Ty3-I Gag-Pol polyprotein [Stylophora pistillata]|uniref:Transposon Ty3-I Gag-Pol polyprotein n=1 Tax=Stylophora pistillata TaxID=50429 RepID=A0A2B4R920_STYPI|nr:Transposon Ty3-I Gag-Pol polyprotein [Stylophora pistillata]